MNANELADELERPNNWQQENNFTTRAATMLRQQQVEIEALKARFNPYQSITDTKIETTVVSYTHPAELSDGEIERIYFQTESVWDKDGNFQYLEFARAILRKAQEK